MTVRLKAAAGRNGFLHGDLDLDGKRWRPVEIDSEAKRQTLRDFHGRYVQVHPEDVAKLKDVGLELDAGDDAQFKALVDIKSDPETPATDTKKSNSKTATTTAATKEK